MQVWQRTEPTTITDVGWRKIVTKSFTMPDGTTAKFDTMNTEGSEFAGVVALTSDNNVIVARQFRPGPEKVVDEIPGGAVDDGESPLEAARRELIEETGYVPRELSLLGSVSKDAYMNGTWHFFLARDCVKSQNQELSENEHVDVIEVSIDQFITNAKNGNMTDHAAVLLAYDQLQSIKNGGK